MRSATRVLVHLVNLCTSQFDPSGNTIIAIVSDFGQAFGPEHGDHTNINTTASALFEENLRTFFIVYDPLHTHANYAAPPSTAGTFAALWRYLRFS